jgi:glucosamine--fructose-6-phosphate aminotransferase (isomerizing)
VITNVAESLAAQEAATVVRTSAGIEIGVAATKTFAAQLTALATIAVRLGERRGHLNSCEASHLIRRLTATANDVRRVLEEDDVLGRVAKILADAPYAMYLGRGESLPVALEGALKIKEIAYLPVEATSAGEMKHGPIALVEQEIPVVMVLPDGPDFEKALANLHEVQARGADVIAVTTRDDRRIRRLARETVELPRAHPAFAALVSTVALQLLAYHAARHRGLDPDRPRNLAKTVTVE